MYVLCLSLSCVNVCAYDFSSFCTISFALYVRVHVLLNTRMLSVIPHVGCLPSLFIRLFAFFHRPRPFLSLRMRFSIQSSRSIAAHTFEMINMYCVVSINDVRQNMKCEQTNDKTNSTGAYKQKETLTLYYKINFAQIRQDSIFVHVTQSIGHFSLLFWCFQI